MYAYVDFEFFGSNEPHPSLVCATVIYGEEVEEYWLLDGEGWEDLKFRLNDLANIGFILVAFGAVAEARCLLALGLDPCDFQWHDLHFEYKCLLNHNDELEWGKQLIEGKTVTTYKPRPKYQRTKSDEKLSSTAAEKSLAAACYKLLGIKIDTAHKETMRDIIISGNVELIEGYREDIMAYCTSDVVHLEKLQEVMIKHHQKLMINAPKSIQAKLPDDMLARGAWAAEIAHIESTGYPVNVPAMRAFSNSVPDILFECQRDINSQFAFKPFIYHKQSGQFSWKKKATAHYIRQIYPELVGKWELTEGKELSMSLEAFTEFFDFKHDYPKCHFGAQMVRYLKLKQSLNGFIPSKTGVRKTIWDFLGSDGFVRPYTNPYGSQSGRNQPSATSFLFLKPAWMRVMCEPPEGFMMLGADWSSQEFLIGALLSNDTNMIEAYHSGDPYLWFGKAAGRIPKDGTKESHGALRDRFKSSVLGIMYLMGAESLARKITNDTGVFCSVDDAQKFIDLFDKVFYRFAQWREDVLIDYREDGYHRLSDGWTMYGDNPNFRSITNCPIQGAGAAILRRAVRMARERGLKITMTLHDALYPMTWLGDWDSFDTLADVMVESFKQEFPKHKEEHKTIRSDLVAWSPEFRADVKEYTTVKGRKVTIKQKYVDKRSLADYERFKIFTVASTELDAL